MKDFKTLFQLTKDLKLLYAEDNRYQRESAKEMFENFFLQVSVAQDGQEALEMFEKEPFDLLITDLSMPRMDGFELIESIKETAPTLPVIVFSAWDDPSYINRCIKLNIDAYMNKPLKADNLIDAIYKVSLQMKDTRQVFKNSFDIDKLTSLKSHNLFLEELKDVNSIDIPVMILINIDDFYTYNELYGLENGDKILSHFAHNLETFNKESDYQIFRLSGNEFVFYEKVTAIDPDKYTEDIESLFDFIEKNPIKLAEIEELITLNMTIGISFNNDNLYGKADMALHEARKRGRRYLGFSADADRRKELKHNLYWREEIAKALTGNHIHTYYQPIVDVNENILRYEALMRMKQVQEDGEIALVSPANFIDFSKISKQYIQLTKIVIEESFASMLQYNVDISINITFHDIENHEINKLLRKNISQHKLANRTKFDISSQVIFELLEHSNSEDYERFISFIDEFKALGVLITIDNFGMGFANMSKIAAMAPNYVKIDSILMKNINTDKHSLSLVKAIVKFTKELGIKTIAEHVTSKEIFEISKAIGIDEFQGYYFSEPLESIHQAQKETL